MNTDKTNCRIDSYSCSFVANFSGELGMSCVGLDLGQRHDLTAIAVVEKMTGSGLLRAPRLGCDIAAVDDYGRGAAAPEGTFLERAEAGSAGGGAGAAGAWGVETGEGIGGGAYLCAVDGGDRQAGAVGSGWVRGTRRLGDRAGAGAGVLEGESGGRSGLGRGGYRGFEGPPERAAAARIGYPTKS
jgi:hypothetical protein